MSGRRGPLRFLCWFSLLYATMVLPWPGVGDAYRVYFSGFVRVLCSPFPEGTVTVGTWPEGRTQSGHNLDCYAALENPEKSPKKKGARWNSSETGFLPTAFTLALLLATPGSIRRRIVTAVVGILFVHLFIAVRIALPVIVIAGAPQIGILDLSPAVRGTIRQIGNALKTPAATFFVPLLIWLAMVYARKVRTMTGNDEKTDPGRSHSAAPGLSLQ